MQKGYFMNRSDTKDAKNPNRINAMFGISHSWTALLCYLFTIFYLILNSFSYYSKE